MKRNEYSHLTAKERDALSFPSRWLYQKGLLQGSILDFGCGYGKDVELLKLKGLDIIGYDKFYQPEYPSGRFETIICHYVLNVLFPEEQAQVLMSVSELLQPGGKAYFTVRRDIKYEGFRMHKIHKKPTYQCNVRLPYYSILKTDSCEIYKYRHFNFIRNTGIAS
jgi:SAM-dependent methyltransferase